MSTSIDADDYEDDAPECPCCYVTLECDPAGGYFCPCCNGEDEVMTEQCFHCKQVFEKTEIKNLLGSDFEIIARVCTGCYGLLR